MSEEKFIEQVRELKATLEELEKRLASSEVPLSVLEDFKRTVDHTRMTLWAILSAAQEQQGNVSTFLVRFRLRRAEEICRQVADDVQARKVSPSFPELPQFHATVKSTLDGINRLYRTGL